MKKPNILFLFTDDQRFDTIAALGNPHIKTPVMDALVARGTTFTHACIPGGTCGAVCMPSRAMLHSGRHLHHLENSGTKIPAEHALLGETLRQEGYHTFGMGKWHNGVNAFQRSFSDGAEIFFGGMADHWNVPAFHYDPTGMYDATMAYCPDPFLSRKLEWRGGDHIHAGRHSTDIFGNTAIDFIDSYDRDEPFFAYVSFMAPHDPRTMPEPFASMYDPKDISLPENFLGGHPFPTGALTIRDEMLAAFPRNPDEIRTHIAEYYGMISHLDHVMGQILSALDRKGIAEDTIIILAGDNGLAVGQHGLMGKQSAYDHSVRVPLIFAGPGIPENTRTGAFAYLMDIFPTLCDVLQVPCPETVDGMSLLPAMKNPELPLRDAVYLNYETTIRAVRTSTHKLVEYFAEGQRNTQLFDLVADPLERVNLAGMDAHADLVATLRGEMLRLRDAWEDATSPTGSKFWPHIEWAQTTA